MMKIVVYIAICLVLTILIWRNSRTLHRSDARRKQVEEALRSAYDDLELRVDQRTVELSRVNETLRGKPGLSHQGPQSTGAAQATKSCRRKSHVEILAGWLPLPIQLI